MHHGELKSGCGATVMGCSEGDIDGLTGAAIGTDVLVRRRGGGGDGGGVCPRASLT